jgi:hypothetical protein
VIVENLPNHGLQADGGTAVIYGSVVQAHVRDGFAPAAEPWPFGSVSCEGGRYPAQQ